MVIVAICLGIGNQLFQYAFAKSLQMRGADVYLDADAKRCGSFGYSGIDTVRTYQLNQCQISVPIADEEKLQTYDYLLETNSKDRFISSLSRRGAWFHHYYEDKTNGYNPEFLRIKNGYIAGWFQSERYFASIRGDLLHDLKPAVIHEEAAFLSERMNDEDCVSIHVRRGDYVNGGVALSRAYYRLAMREVERYMNNPKYYVFSDDICWAKRNIGNRQNIMYVNENREFNEMNEIFLMTKCKVNIISNSTYSWWGAWLNNRNDKKVYAPKLWYPNQKGIVPKEWTVI